MSDDERQDAYDALTDGASDMREVGYSDAEIRQHLADWMEANPNPEEADRD